MQGIRLLAACVWQFVARCARPGSARGLRAERENTSVAKSGPGQVRGGAAIDRQLAIGTMSSSEPIYQVSSP